MGHLFLLPLWTEQLKLHSCSTRKPKHRKVPLLVCGPSRRFGRESEVPMHTLRVGRVASQFNSVPEHSSWTIVVPSFLKSAAPTVSAEAVQHGGLAGIPGRHPLLPNTKTPETTAAPRERWRMIRTNETSPQSNRVYQSRACISLSPSTS